MKSPRAVLTAIFAVSGASGLIYEVAWMRTLRLLVGSTTLSHTIVLAAFMAGLALGAWIAGRRIDKAARPLRVYAWLEAAIGAYGLLFPLLARVLVPPLGALYRSFEESPIAFTLGELLVLGPIVLPGAALMGATLPALGRVVAQTNVAREGGWLYAVNTLGAAVGAAIAGFVLLPLVGLTATIVAAAATNFVLSWLAFRLEPSVAVAPPSEDTSEEKGAPRLAALAVMTSALAGMTLQIAWTKLFVVCVGSSTFAFTGVVTVYILGIGAGAALAVRILGRSQPGRLLACASLGAGLAAGLTPPFFAWFPEVVASVVQSRPNIVLVLAVETLCVALALGPATVLLGTIFPLGVAVAGGSPAQSGRALARISVASSIGSIVGALVGGLVLVRLFGLTGAVRAGALLAGAAGVFGLLASDLRRVWALPAVAALVATCFLRGPDAALLDSGAFLYGRQRFAAATEPGAKRNVRRAAHLVHHSEGEDLVAAIYESGTEHFLVVNGKIDASSHGDAETQRLVAHVPIFLHGPPVKNVAIVGLGSGMTADAALAHPGVERVDTIEISKTVVDAVRASPLFMQLTHHALDDPRHRLLIADGRTHLRHSTQRYDVIISEPTNPWIAGVGDLYTTEHFTNVKERLAPGGVFAQWLQGYGTTARLYKTIVRTFTDVFPDAQLWRFAESSDTLLVARREPGVPLTIRFSSVKEDVLRAPRLKESLEDAGMEAPESLAWYFDLDPPGTRALGGEGVKNTDDSGWLEHRAPFALYQYASPLEEDAAKTAMAAAVSPFPELSPEDAQRIRAILPDYHEAVRAKGRVDGSGLADAEALLHRVVAAVPGNSAIARERLAAVIAERLARKQYGGEAPTRAAFAELGGLNARSPNVLDLYAQAARIGKLPRAEEKALRRLIELRPLSSEPRVRLAELYAGERNHAAALDALAPVSVETADVLATRGLALAGLGKVDDARAAIEKALAKDPLSSRAWSTLGVIRAQAGDFAGAVLAFEKVVELRPRDALGWFQLGLARFKLGDKTGAEACCKEALRLDPEDERAKGLLAHMKR